MANGNETGILDNLPDQAQATTVPRGTTVPTQPKADIPEMLRGLPDTGRDPNALLGLRGAPDENAMDSAHRNFLAFGINPSLYGNMKQTFDEQAKLHPEAVNVLNITDIKLNARAEEHAADPSIPVIRQGQPLTKWQKTRLWFEDQFGITAKRQLEFEAQREGLTPEELADRVASNNVRLDRYLKFDPAAGALGVMEGVAGGLSWLTDGEIGQDFADQAQILREEMAPVDPNFLDAVSQGTGSMAMFFVPGLGVGSGVTRIFTVAPRVARILGASTMTGLEAMTEAGLVWRDIYRKTGDQAQADKAANATFWLNVPLLFVTNKMGIFAEGGNRLSRFVTSAALEGTQEVGQEIISASQTGEEIKFKDLATVFGVGAIIGGGAGTITGLLQETAPVAAEVPSISPETAPEQVNITAPATEESLAGEVEQVVATSPEFLQDLVESDLTDEQVVNSLLERLIEPVQGEEGAITIDTRDTVTIQDEQFNLSDPVQRERAIDRGIELFRETGEIDMNSAIADEIIREKLLLDELGEEGTAQTAIQARREREIAERGAEQEARLRDFRQGQLQERLRQEAIDKELTLFSETGQIDLTSPVALDVIKSHILNEAYTVRDNFNDILDIGRSIFAEGRTRLEDFTTRMKETLGEAWEKVKPYLKTAWDVLNNERGSIDLTPEGKPVFDLDAGLQSVRLQLRGSQISPAFMQEHDTWTDEEVSNALDKAEKGKPVTEREAEMIHASLAEAGANFYQEVMESEDDFINPLEYLEEGELDQIIQTGIENYLNNVKVVRKVELTAEQKKKKARTKEFRQRGEEIKKLQGQLQDTAYLLHQSVQDQASIRRQAKEDTKIAREQVKRLESKIATRDRQIDALREKIKNTAKTLPRLSVKAQIRQSTGQAPTETLVREGEALKASLKAASRAALAAQRAQKAEDNLLIQGARAEERAKAQLKTQELREKAREALQDVKDKAVMAREKTQETARRNQLRRQIKKALRTTKPTKQAGKPVGKFTPEIQRTLDKLREAANLNPIQALSRINDNLAKYPDDIPPDDVALENRIISMVHDFGSRTVPQLETLLTEIRALIDEGRMINELKKFNRQTKLEQDRAIAMDDITGGQGLPEGADLKTRKAQYDRITGVTDRAKRWFATTGKTMVGWKDVLDILSRLSESPSFESDLSKLGDVLDAKNAEKRGLRDSIDTVQKAYRDAYGIDQSKRGDREAIKKIREDSKPIDLGNFVDLEGRTVPIEITKAEARKRYMEFQDPSLTSTFIEGMAYTEEMKAAITEILTPQDKAFAEAQMAYYQEYYNSINDVYRDIYGVDLPKNEFYSPIRREGFAKDSGTGFGEFLQEINMRASTAPGGLKTRTENILPITQVSDMNILEQHITEMEHFKAWADRVRDLRGVFNDVEVRQAIEIFHGKDMLGVIDNFIDDFARGGVNRGLRMSWIDKWRARIARSVLAVKPSIGFKQLTSFVAYADSMPVAEFVKGTVDFWKNPIENTRFIYKHSTLLQERGGSIERDIRDAQQTDAYKAWRKGQSFLNALMLNIHIGDQGAIVMGGWPLIKYQMDKGTTIEEAIRKFESVTESTQQSADLSELSVFQRGGSFAKLFTLYRSSPNQYFRKVMGALRNAPGIGSGRQSVTQTTKTMTIFWILLPMLFQYVADGFEWDEEEQKRAVVMGPLNGIFIAGDIIEGIIRKIQDERVYDSEIPLLGLKDDAIKALPLIGPDNLTDDEFLRAIRGAAAAVGSVTGVPLKTAVDVGAGVDEILTGDFEKGAAQVLGWSPSVAEKMTRR